MSYGLPDDWYIEPTGESRILDQEKVAAEMERKEMTRKFGDVEKTYWQNEPMHLEVGPEDELRLVAGTAKKSQPNEIIERVAKAVCEQMGVRRADRIEIARAAIAAMREPTDEMKNASEEIHWDYSCPMCGGLKDGWYCMIDAALKE